MRARGRTRGRGRHLERDVPRLRQIEDRERGVVEQERGAARGDVVGHRRVGCLRRAARTTLEQIEKQRERLWTNGIGRR